MQRRAAQRSAAATTDTDAVCTPPAADAAPACEPATPRWPGIRFTFALTYAAFAACYLARANAAVAKRPLAAALSLSDAALGGLDALFLGAYTAGNFAFAVRVASAAHSRARAIACHRNA